MEVLLRWPFVLFVAVSFLYLINWRPRGVGISLKQSKSNPKPDTLVVQVHGMVHHATYRGIFGIVRQSLPDADHLILKYDATPLANGSLDRLAALMEKRINAATEKGGYQTIILAGYSVGALLARRTYLNNYARRDDASTPAWWDKVSRIVLVVGLNGGWNRDHIRWSGLMMNLAKTLGLATLFAETERGRPFVENLRIDFLNFTRTSPYTPDIVQLVGIKDTVVDAESDMDLQASPKSYFLGIDETGHYNFGNVGNARRGEDFRIRGTKAQTQRAQAYDFLFRGNLADPAASDAPEWIINQLGMPISKRTSWGDPRVERVVIILHGIRDQGHWADRFRLHIEGVIGAQNVAVVSPSFGRFSMTDFIFPVFRQRDKAIRWFARLYSEIIAKYPNTQSIDFIGHSYGTYVFANALHRYASMRFRRAYLAGSVLPTDHDWTDVFESGRLESLANATADNDLIVGVFPACYQKVQRLFSPGRRKAPVGGFFDLGDAGVNGFNCSHKRHTRVDFLRGGHGAFTSSFDYLDLASEYVVHGQGKEFNEKIRNLSSRGELSNQLPFSIKMANLFSPLIWLIGIALFWFGYDRLFALASPQLPDWIDQNIVMLTDLLPPGADYAIGGILAVTAALYVLSRA